MLKNKGKHEDRLHSNIKMFRYAVVMLTISVVCSLSLIIINSISLIENRSVERDEINYFFLVAVASESEISNPEDFDSYVINGGVAKVNVDDPYLAEKLGVLPSNVSVETDEEILYRYFDYLGAFGWQYISCDKNTFVFCRN